MKRPNICVPIVERTRKGIIQKACEIKEYPCNIVEWRIDFFEEIMDVLAIKEVAKEISNRIGEKELLVTWRTVREGGEEVPEGASYVNTLSEIAAADVCQYIDIEMEHAGGLPILKLAQEKHLKVIGSYHDFSKTPTEKELVDRLIKMQEMGFDYGKIAVMPKTFGDVDVLLEATEKASEKMPDFSVVTMSMGELGKRSRLYGWLYGSCMTFGCVGDSSAPGQVPVEQLHQVLQLGHNGKRHLILIGFMGVGKSTISQKLAELSGRQEIDTDAEIVKKEGRSIANIFASEGEEYFRQIETDMIDAFDDFPPSIISCGGGMALRQINVKKLRAIGTIVLLKAEPGTIYERVKDSKVRPLLNNNMNVSFISGLMEKRRPFYEDAAEVIAVTDNLTADDIAKSILEQF